MTDRKHPLWPWIVATVISSPVLYVLGFGPWSYIHMQAWIPEWADYTGETFFAPLNWYLYERHNSMPDNLCVRYVNWWCELALQHNQ